MCAAGRMVSARICYLIFAQLIHEYQAVKQQHTRCFVYSIRFFSVPVYIAESIASRTKRIRFFFVDLFR